MKANALGGRLSNVGCIGALMLFLVSAFPLPSIGSAGAQSSVSVEASYTYFSPGSWGSSLIFQQNVGVNEVVTRELSGSIVDPDPSRHPNGHLNGYHLLIQTLVPDETYRIIGVGGRGGGDPAIAGLVRLRPPFEFGGFEDSLVISGQTVVFDPSAIDRACDPQGPPCASIKVDRETQKMNWFAKSICQCAYPDGAGMFFSLIITKKVPVVVTVVRARAVDPIDTGEADFYPKVTIDGQQFVGQVMHDLDDAFPSPEWRFVKRVDSANVSVPITIELWDWDALSAGDQTDIDPLSGDRLLSLSFFPGTGNFGGDVSFGYARGEGDTLRAEIWFDVAIGTRDTNNDGYLDSADADGDALLDNWERVGLHTDDDGIVDVNLPLMGAKVFVKDIFVEVDWMKDWRRHRPTKEALRLVVDAFSRQRIALHLDDGSLGGGNEVGHQDSTWFLDHPLLSDFWDIKRLNFDPNRTLVFRYALYVHTIAFTPVGIAGMAEIGGNDFIIASHVLEGYVNRVYVQAAVFMHELGHTLNLRHGGNDDIGCKPNHISVMNYAMWEGIEDSSGRLRMDYSHSRLRMLSEWSLDEGLGVGAAGTVHAHDRTWFRDGLGREKWGLASGPIDWNGDGWIEGRSRRTENVAVNVNNIESRAPCRSWNPWETLHGYDEWSNLAYNFRLFGTIQNGIVGELPVELGVEQLEALRREAF